MIKVNLKVEDKIHIKNKDNLENHIKKKIRKIYKLFPIFKKKNIAFTILIAGSNKIKKLNFKFRKKNKTTDVLSFPFYSNIRLQYRVLKKIYLGDIALSHNILNIRSKKSDFLLEFDKLWIHGFLHLLGYDHIKNSDFKKMSKIEKKILNLT